MREINTNYQPLIPSYMKIISEHKKNYGAKGRNYTWTRPVKGMKRVMAIVNGRTRHIDIPAANW